MVIYIIKAYSIIIRLDNLFISWYSGKMKKFLGIARIVGWVVASALLVFFGYEYVSTIVNCPVNTGCQSDAIDIFFRILFGAILLFHPSLLPKLFNRLAPKSAALRALTLEVFIVVLMLICYAIFEHDFGLIDASGIAALLVLPLPLAFSAYWAWKGSNSKSMLWLPALKSLLIAIFSSAVFSILAIRQITEGCHGEGCMAAIVITPIFIVVLVAQVILVFLTPIVIYNFKGDRNPNLAKFILMLLAVPFLFFI
jgi:hypothetical protein